MPNLTRISQFLAFILPHAYRDANVVKYAGQIDKDEQWPYIFGDYGQDVGGQPAADCNGVSEEVLNYADPSMNHNTRSRFNFSTWCDGHNGEIAKHVGPFLPGTAVFAGDSPGSIHHVGYIVCQAAPGVYLVAQDESERLDFKLTLLRTGPGHFVYYGEMRKYFDYDLPADYNIIKSPIAFDFTTCPYPVPAALPAFGSTGDAVRFIQWQCIMRGHLIDSSGPLHNGIDGSFGRLTLAALKAYQRDADVAGDDTIKAMLGQPITPSVPQVYGIDINAVPWLSSSSRGKDVAYLQSLLAANKEDLHLSVKATGSYGMDGNFGPETTAALRHYQQTHKDLDGIQLDDDAVCGPKTWGALLGVPCK